MQAFKNQWYQGYYIDDWVANSVQFQEGWKFIIQINSLQNHDIYLPSRLSSLQVPLIKYLPSGHTQVAPKGFSKHRNSHTKSKHGLGTD